MFFFHGRTLDKAMQKLTYFIMTLDLNFLNKIHIKMISIKKIIENDIDLCYELDSNTISLWTKKQWANEFLKRVQKSLGYQFQI